MFFRAEEVKDVSISYFPDHAQKLSPILVTRLENKQATVQQFEVLSMYSLEQSSWLSQALHTLMHNQEHKLWKLTPNSPIQILVAAPIQAQ